MMPAFAAEITSRDRRSAIRARSAGDIAATRWQNMSSTSSEVSLAGRETPVDAEAVLFRSPLPTRFISPA